MHAAEARQSRAERRASPPRDERRPPGPPPHRPTAPLSTHPVQALMPFSGAVLVMVALNPVLRSGHGPACSRGWRGDGQGCRPGPALNGREAPPPLCRGSLVSLRNHDCIQKTKTSRASCLGGLFPGPFEDCMRCSQTLRKPVGPALGADPLQANVLGNAMPFQAKGKKINPMALICWGWPGPDPGKRALLAGVRPAGLARSRDCRRGPGRVGRRKATARIREQGRQR